MVCVKLLMIQFTIAAILAHEQNSRYFANDFLKYILLTENHNIYVENKNHLPTQRASNAENVSI